MSIQHSSQPASGGLPEIDRNTARRRDFRPWLLLAAVIVIAAAIRLRTLGIPLERDEGEFAYGGQLLLQGVAPVKYLYAMKLPGIYAAYALIMALFGQSAVAIHAGLLVVTAVTTVLVYLFGRRFLGSFYAVIAAAAYAFLSLSPSVLGLAAHATHFVMLFALSGILLLPRSVDQSRPLVLFMSGLLLGCAFLCKQSGAAFIGFAVLELFLTATSRRDGRWRRLAAWTGILAAGCAVPVIATWALLAHAGVLTRSIFWNFIYAREYATLVPISAAPSLFLSHFQQVVRPFMTVWALAVMGVIVLVFRRVERRNAAYLVGFAVFSFIAVVPGYYFRPHYFVQLLPAVALLATAGLRALGQHIQVPSASAQRGIGASLCILGIVAGLADQRAVLFELSPEAASRAIYGTNPFPESAVVARYIVDHSAPDDRIAVIGSEPQIYFLARRRSATGYVYTYSLMEDQNYALPMQREMIREIESVEPRYLVYVGVRASWLPSPASGKLIFSWFQTYHNRYDPVGVVDIPASGAATYRWGAEALSRGPQSPNFMLVLERKERRSDGAPPQ
jgi:hypothetical protein